MQTLEIMRSLSYTFNQVSISRWTSRITWWISLKRSFCPLFCTYLPSHDIVFFSLPGSLFILTHLIHIIYCRSIPFPLPSTLIFLPNQSVNKTFPNSHLWCHHPFWCSVLEAVNMPLLGHSTGTSTPSTSPQEMEDPNSHKSVTVYFIWKSIFQTLFTLLRQRSKICPKQPSKTIQEENPIVDIDGLHQHYDGNSRIICA